MEEKLSEVDNIFHPDTIFIIAGLIDAYPEAGRALASLMMFPSVIGCILVLQLGIFFGVMEIDDAQITLLGGYSTKNFLLQWVF